MKNQQTFRQLFWLSIISVMLMVVWGYSFGRGNSIQLIPYLQHTHDHSLFSNDFFVQYATQNLPNERSLFLLLLQPFGVNLEWPAFIFYVLCTLAMLYAMLQIAFYFLKNYALSYAAIIITFFPLLYHTLGLNEIYGGEFNSSLISDVFSLWAILFMLRNRIGWCYAALILATCMHPLSGMQTFLLISGALLFTALANKNYVIIKKQYLLPVLIYVFTAGTFIVLLQLRLHDVEWNEADFFRAFFVFRNGHHYLPTEYKHLDWLILGPLYLITPLIYFKRNKQVFVFSLLILIGCILFSIGVLILESTTIATAQWFKTTMWIEWFAVIGLLLLGQKVLQRLNKPLLQRLILPAVIIVSGLYAFLVFPKIPLKNDISYEFPFYKKITPEIDIATQAKQVTPKNALFIEPCSFDQLKYYGQRSSFVDYKALTHSKSFIKEWTTRFKAVYQIDPLTSETISFTAMREADERYRKLTTEQLTALKTQYGITHIIMYADNPLPFKKLASNDRFAIYEL